MIKTTAKTLFLAAAGLLSIESAAAASSGTLTGTFKFHQKQGNYSDGTGAKYPKSQYNTARPVRYAKVQVRRASDNKVLGNGTTNSNGYWTVNWSDSSTSGNVSVKLRWYPEHKDDRFRINTSSGGRWAFHRSGTVTAVKNSTKSTGTATWGSSSNPNKLANVYDGASKMWSYSLSQSNRMNSYFGNLKPSGSGATKYVSIRSFVDDGSCPTGLAWGSLNRICLPTGGAFMPQSRVMHEMGHIADYFAHRDQSYKVGGDYNYGGDSGWGPTEAEYHGVQFHEAVATHLATVGLYYDSASKPRTCISSGACGTDLEYKPSSCSSSRRRWPLSAERYFWDTYDSKNDSESLRKGVWHIVDTIHAFNNGTGNRQKDEVWNSSRTSLDDRDGHSTKDFMENWKTWGTNSSTALSNNCTPSDAD